MSKIGKHILVLFIQSLNVSHVRNIMFGISLKAKVLRLICCFLATGREFVDSGSKSIGRQFATHPCTVSLLVAYLHVKRHHTKQP